MSPEHDNPPLERRRGDPTALLSGLLFVAVGLGFLAIGSGYSFGTARSMGPGYFPRVLAIILVVLGAIIALGGRAGQGEPIGRVNLKGLFLVTVAALVFAILIRPAGVAPAIVVAVLLSTAATPTFDWWKALILAVAVALFSSLVFVTGLGLPIPIFGPWFSF